jgi:hypothetical protein
MRLTLRTLLAYLDDTLEPSEAKLIGQKVAESDTAQELIARIREVTRRRRITTPTASGPGAKVDPNSIAEYLDNELSAEQLAEVEQLALSSDVHLAEVAACHQILTLVLGEPALVPPQAFKRMYKLVAQPESSHLQAPPVQRGPEDEPLNEPQEVDETLRLGIPALRANNWNNRLILLGGLAACFLLLAIAVWQLLPPFGVHDDVGEGGGKGTGRLIGDLPTDKKAAGKTDHDGKGKKDTDKATDKKIEPIDKGTDKITDKGTDKSTDKATDKKTDKDTSKETSKEKDAPGRPSTVVKNLGVYEGGAVDKAGAVLLQKVSEDDKKGRWVRMLKPNTVAVRSYEPLLSLPGYQSVVALDSGARLTLFGTVPEVWVMPLTREAVVLLHASDSVDLDMTLVRGRVILANTKDQPLKVRVRFDNPTSPKKGEIWDITLAEKGTEVVLTLWTMFNPGDAFYPKPNTRRNAPTTHLQGFVQTGKATFSTDLNKTMDWLAQPEGQILAWDSKKGEVKQVAAKEVPPWFFTAPATEVKTRAGMTKALEELNRDLTSPKASVEGVLAKAVGSSDLDRAKLALRCCAAMDDVEHVIDALGNSKSQDLRWEAIAVLREWIAHNADNDYVLFDKLQPTYSAVDATEIMTLLHPFAPEQWTDPKTYELLQSFLEHRKTALKELAHLYLCYVAQQGRDFSFNASASNEQNRTAILAWNKLIPKGSLPPGLGK